MNTSYVKKQKGFALLVAIITTSMLLLVSFVVANIAYKQLLITFASKQSQSAFYAADSGLECAIYWDIKNPPSGGSAFDPSTPGTITCNGQTITSSSGSNPQTVDTVPPSQAVIGGSGGGGSVETVWFEDSLPAGASPAGDAWNWVGSSPSPFSGSFANQSANSAGLHQQYFTGANPFTINTGDTLIAYVYLNPASPPNEIMLQWNDGAGGWEHRAYWGANVIGWGSDGTDSRRYQGPLPATGVWVKLSVPASQVGLEGATLNGMAFTLNDGQATWDHVGKSAVSGGGGGSSGNSIFELNFSNGTCVITRVIKNADGTTQINSSGYNTCQSGAGRRYERGVFIRY